MYMIALDWIESISYRDKLCNISKDRIAIQTKVDIISYRDEAGHLHPLSTISQYT